MSHTRIGSRSQQLINYVKNAVYSIPALMNAVYDTGVAAAGAKVFATQQFTSRFAQILFIAPLSLFSFFQSIGLNFKSTIESIKETELIVRARRIPSDWIPLTRQQENVAIGISVFITAGSAFGDFCGANYFVSELPADFSIQNDVNQNGWIGFSAFTGLIAGVTTILTEGAASYQNVRCIIGKDKTPYTRTWLAFTVGYFLVSLAALEVGAETYAGVKKTVPGSSTAFLKWALLIPSATKIASDFFFAGKITLSALDDFAMLSEESVRYLYDNYRGFRLLIDTCWDARAEFCALAIWSLGAAIWVEYPQQALTDDLLDDEDTALPFPIPVNFTILLGWVASIRDGILQMATLYPLFLFMMYKMCCLPTQPESANIQPLHPIGLGLLTHDSSGNEEFKVEAPEDIAAAEELMVEPSQRTTESLMQGTLTFYRAKLVHRQNNIATPIDQIYGHLVPRFNL